jgi:hypothetical protein
MSGIRPSQLTNEELVRYARLEAPGNLPPEWVEEILKRFEQTLDDNR